MVVDFPTRHSNENSATIYSRDQIIRSSSFYYTTNSSCSSSIIWISRSFIFNFQIANEFRCGVGLSKTYCRHGTIRISIKTNHHFHWIIYLKWTFRNANISLVLVIKHCHHRNTPSWCKRNRLLMECTCNSYSHQSSLVREHIPMHLIVSKI